MVEIANSTGRPATERLLTDWQEFGLIDQPVKKGLGRGKGIAAIWPESQLKLWLLLLDKRRQTSQVPNLCNVPVGLWLYFGDEYASLRQVRKCMTAWAKRYGSSRGHKLAKQTARRLLEDLPRARISKNAKADLVSAMASVLLHGFERDSERRQLRDRLVKAAGIEFDESQKPNRAAAVVDLVLIRLLASHHLSDGSVPDHVFHWARVWHLFNLQSYIEAMDSGRLPDVPGVDFDRPDFNKLIPNACRDLMSAVGMALGIGKEESLPAPFFHPDSWKDGPYDTRVSFEVKPTKILLPRGQRYGHVQIQVTGQIGPRSGFG
jgi:hypothetical protein